MSCKVSTLPVHERKLSGSDLGERRGKEQGLPTLDDAQSDGDLEIL